MTDQAHAWLAETRGGPEPAEERTDVMGGPTRRRGHIEVMGESQPAAERPDVMGGPEPAETETDVWAALGRGPT